MVTVSEEEIIRAIFFLLEREKLVVEGAGAVGVAAILEGKVALSPADTAVCILSGGNIDMNMVSRIIDRGLWEDGRLASLSVVVRDRPGYLNEVTAVVAIEGANVLHIEHTRAFGDIAVGKVGNRDEDREPGTRERGGDRGEDPRAGAPGGGGAVRGVPHRRLSRGQHRSRPSRISHTVPV